VHAKLITVGVCACVRARARYVTVCILLVISQGTSSITVLWFQSADCDCLSLLGCEGVLLGEWPLTFDCNVVPPLFKGARILQNEGHVPVKCQEQLMLCHIPEDTNRQHHSFYARHLLL